MNELATSYKTALKEPAMAVGQRVRIEKKAWSNGRVLYEGTGTVVAWLVSPTDATAVAVVETDDGHFLDCLLHQLRRIERKSERRPRFHRLTPVLAVAS